MKIPTVRKLPSGNYFCQLRIDGKSIAITERSKARCEARALAYKTGVMAIKNAVQSDITLHTAIESYIYNRTNILSPSTIRGYRIIQRNRFSSVMYTPIGNVKNWQKVIDREAETYAPKSVINAWGLVRSVLAEYGITPSVRLPQKIKPSPRFLRPEQIPPFIKAVYPSSKYAVPTLLALSSLRLSEIKALKWEDIPENSRIIRVSGAVVRDENNKDVEKRQNKTVSSARSVPVYMPELRAAINRDRASGYVCSVSESAFRRYINRVCRQLGYDEVGIHGLRHSFASLAYHLNVPEKIVMEIGGWDDENTVRKIYAHIAESDVSHFESVMMDFYEKNANEMLTEI